MPYGRSNTSELILPRGVIGSQDHTTPVQGNTSSLNLGTGSAAYSYYYNPSRYAFYNAQLAIFFDGPNISPRPLGDVDVADDEAEALMGRPEVGNEDSIFGDQDSGVIIQPPVPWVLSSPPNVLTFGGSGEGLAGDRVGGGAGSPFVPTEAIISWPGFDPAGFATPPGTYAGPVHADIPDTIGVVFGESLVGLPDPGITQIVVPAGWLYTTTTEWTFLACRYSNQLITVATKPPKDPWQFFSMGFYGQDNGFIDTDLPIDYYIMSGLGAGSSQVVPAKKWPNQPVGYVFVLGQPTNFGIPWIPIPAILQTVTSTHTGYTGGFRQNLNTILMECAASGSPPDASVMALFPISMKFSIAGIQIPVADVGNMPQFVIGGGFYAI